MLACEGVMSQFWDVPVRGLANFILVSSVPKLSHMKSKHPVEEDIWKGFDYHVGRRALLKSDIDARYIKLSSFLKIRQATR